MSKARNNAAGVLSPVASLNGSPIGGMINRIINGGMVFDQRNNGAAVTASIASTGRPVDLFRYYYEGGGSLTGQRITGDAPTGFTHYLRTTITTTGTQAPNESVCLMHAIEGYNISDLAWGTSSATPAMLSFWYRSSVSGVHSGAIRNADNTRSFPFSFQVNIANTWEYKSVAITGPTTGTWLSDIGVGAYLSFNIGAGFTRLGTAGSWVSSWKSGTSDAVSLMGTLNATIDITGIQFEPGYLATQFTKRLTGTEYGLIRRYLKKINVTVPTSSNPLQMIIDMRDVPVISGGGSGFSSTGTTADVLICSQTSAASQTLILSAEV